MTRGRHRAASSSSRNAAAAATTGALALVPVGVSQVPAWAAEPAPTVNWGPIVACESGGNPHAQNASSTASGLYQFLDSSWKAYGGLKFGPRAKDATATQQTLVANVAFQRSGLSPWAASRSCWAGKVSARLTKATTPVVTSVGSRSKPRHASGHPAARHARSAPARHVRVEARPRRGLGGVYVVRRGESLATIAAAHGLDWRSVWRANKASVPNANLLHSGERLRLPGAG